MISVTFDDRVFQKEMKNLMQYSEGFLEGVQSNKKALLNNLGYQIKDLIGQFIDSNARVDPQSLHHVYEWYQTGSSDARLFDIICLVNGGGLTVSGELTQSQTRSKKASEPFYNKAKIMESGSPVVISPKRSKVLAFEVDGQTVFTSKPVKVDSPGGNVAGNFERAFSLFFQTYSSQSILQMSGLADQLKNSKDFDKRFSAGTRGGRSLGRSVGARWISGGNT
jgi:hypothetical protein